MLRISIAWRKCWLTGLIVVISFGKCAFQSCSGEIMKKEECSETTIDGILCWNCSSPLPNRQCTKLSFPEDLGSSIKCIYSYNMQVPNISSKTFLQYPNLTHLSIIRGSFSSRFPKTTFEPLKQLQFLNLSRSNWFADTEITWPSSLKILDISAFPVSTFVALSLTFLEVLNVSDTMITEFPTLSEIAPLKLVVLDRVDLINFKIEDLAKLCKLESLSMLNTSLGHNNCKCLMLQEWTRKYNVTVINEMHCETDSKCSLTFTAASINNRNTCLDKNAVKRWYVVVIIAVAIGPLLLLLFGCGFLYFWLIKKEQQEGILGITDEQLKHFTPRAKNVTDEPTETSEVTSEN